MHGDVRIQMAGLALKIKCSLFLEESGLSFRFWSGACVALVKPIWELFFSPLFGAKFSLPDL